MSVVWLPMVAGALLGAPAGEGRETPVIQIARRPDGVPPPVVDGRLDDPAWAHAAALGRLVQVEPIEGAEPSERTEIGLLYDHEALYVRLLCHDREPERIRDSQMKRDADLDPDDRVEILIDPFLDRRNAFWFQIGAGGAMGDALITKNGASFNKQWDGIWLGRSRVTARGWEAEMRIPVATLNFDPDAGAWGFNLVRHIRRHSERVRWASAYHNVRFFSVADAGTITGISGLHQGLGVDLTPFAVADFTRDRTNDDDSTTGDLGLDGIWRVTPDVKLTLSYNTDFAETEVDQRRVNLTRFPLFFPEKRDFFLEDSGAFFFGYGSGFGRSSDVIPFFSRRIGLDEDGNEVPLLGAAKLTAQTEGYTVGLLDAQTEANGTFDEANLFAGRFSKNLFERSDMGLIYTHGDPDGVGDASTVGGDFNYRTGSFLGDRNLNLSTWFLASESSEPDGDGSAFSAYASYPNDEIDLSLSYTYVEEDFDPKLGFVRRTGVKKYSGEAEWRPRLPETAFRWLEFQVEPTVYTTMDDELESSRIEIQPFGFQLESGERGSIEVTLNEERLDEDFEISDGVIIPIGEYPFVRGSLRFGTSDKRPLSVRTEISAGEFYDGEREDLELGLEWRASRWVQLGVEYERNDVHLPADDFVVNLGRVELALLANPDLSWTQYLQFDDVSDFLTVNSRLWWIPKPGAQVFLVLNHGWDATDDSFVPMDTSLSFKVGYTLRF